MKFFTLITGLLGILVLPLQGQEIFKFRPSTSIPLLETGTNLTLAWAGGLNSAQYSTIDLNGDELDDLVIFDRTTNKITTFTSNGSSYQYNPQFEYLFPPDLNSWMLLADYNCDGKKDLFTNTTFGLKVYRNTSGQQLSFELQEDPLMTESGSLMVNLQVSSSDLPSISDVDGDGDLDILVFRFATGNGVEYHQNQTIEIDGTCDHLQYKLITSHWGDFQECTCGEYAFGDDDCNPIGGRSQHAGGKSILTFDQDHDGDLELIFGDEFCTNIAFLNNYGDQNKAVFNDALLSYPTSANPIDFFIFPGLFLEDLNFDGRKDLIASPNLFENYGQQVDFKHSSFFYPNDGVAGGEFFTFQSAEFLQDQMIELGESATPAFMDIDGDGDQDMIVGQRGNKQGAILVASLMLYENTGGSTPASYELSTEDYLGLTSSQLNSVKPSFGDLDGDGRLDFLFSAADARGQTSIYYFLNNSNSGFEAANSLPLTLTFEIQAGDHPHFSDINADGRADLLLGRRTGRLEYWRNNSSMGNYNFELIDETVAGITDDSFRRELAPMASDLNDDGNLELVTTDATGVMRLYTNFLNTGESNPGMMFDLLIEPMGNHPVVRSRWGRGASLSSANLGGALPHIVVGSKQGGVFLLENFSTPGGASGGNEFSLELFPNPGDELVTIRGNQGFTIEIYNSLGQLMLDGLSTTDQSVIRFDTRLLNPGIYLVNGVSGSGAKQVKKLIVTR